MNSRKFKFCKLFNQRYPIFQQPKFRSFLIIIIILRINYYNIYSSKQIFPLFFNLKYFRIHPLELWYHGLSEEILLSVKVTEPEAIQSLGKIVPELQGNIINALKDRDLDIS